MVQIRQIRHFPQPHPLHNKQLSQSRLAPSNLLKYKKNTSCRIVNKCYYFGGKKLFKFYIFLPSGWVPGAHLISSVSPGSCQSLWRPIRVCPVESSNKSSELIFSCICYQCQALKECEISVIAKNFFIRIACLHVYTRY